MKTIKGDIGYFGLENWWLSAFGPSERAVGGLGEQLAALLSELATILARPSTARKAPQLAIDQIGSLSNDFDPAHRTIRALGQFLLPAG